MDTASTYRQKFDVILYALQLTNIYQMGGETPQQPAGWWVASTRDPGLLSIWPTDDPSTRVPPVAGLGVYTGPFIDLRCTRFQKTECDTRCESIHVANPSMVCDNIWADLGDGFGKISAPLRGPCFSTHQALARLPSFNAEHLIPMRAVLFQNQPVLCALGWGGPTDTDMLFGRLGARQVCGDFALSSNRSFSPVARGKPLSARATLRLCRAARSYR